jgi:ribokinase
MRVAVIGHVEHITMSRVDALPSPGDIVHLDDPIVFAGGGGGVAFFQFVRSDAEVHLFTALGLDDGALEVHDAIRHTDATIHAALRQTAHTRDLVLITPDGERTIMVVGEPLHPEMDDRLSWDVLAGCDAVYFTGQDAATLVAARDAKFLVATARRSKSIAASGVTPDIIVGSTNDPREASKRSDYANPPRALVMTSGAAGGIIETASGTTTFSVPRVDHIVGRYGAGDTFAAALTWYASRDMSIENACARAAEHAAAVLRGINPLDHQLPLQ